MKKNSYRKLYISLVLTLVLGISLYALFYNNRNNSNTSVIKTDSDSINISYLNNTSWITVKTTNLLGLHPDSVWCFVPKSDSMIWNYSGVNFDKKHTFNSYNSWECGNDCFINVSGKYYLSKDSILEIKNTNVEENAYCGSKIEFSKESQWFKISLKKDTLKLIPLKK